MTKTLSGIHWILVTPFDRSEEIDFPCVPKLISAARAAGCVGVVTLAVSSEGARLTDYERTAVLEQVFAAASGFPVTVSTTAASTKAAIVGSKEAEKLGASTLLIAAPPMAKPNLAGLMDHYARIADAVEIPIVAQDFPQYTGVRMPLSFICELVEKVPQVKYLKLEDPPTPTKISAIRELMGERLGVFGGGGGLYLLQELTRGGIGAMTGFAFPELLVKIYRLVLEGNEPKAREEFYRYLPLMHFEMQVEIELSIRKEAIFQRGLINTPQVRNPGVMITDDTRKELATLVRCLGVL